MPSINPRPRTSTTPGQVDPLDFDRPLEEHGLEVVDTSGDVEELAFAPQAQIRRDLVISTPRGVQFPARRPRQFGHPPLDGGVDVLITLDEHERR
jgi:hypothetical protein